MSINRGMNKEDVVHMYNGILPLKKTEIMPFVAIWMDVEMIILSEVSQSDKARQVSYDFTYM